MKTLQTFQDKFIDLQEDSTYNAWRIHRSYMKKLHPCIRNLYIMYVESIDHEKSIEHAWIINRPAWWIYIPCKKNIRIFNGCAVQIENSVTRVTVRHHSARTIIPSEGIFNSHRTAIMDSFSCMPSLRQLHLSLIMRYFYNFMLKQLSIKKCSVLLLSTTLTLKCLVENDVKNWLWSQKDSLMSCTRIVLHPLV